MGDGFRFLNQFFFDTVQFYAYIGNRDAHNGRNFVVTDALQPQQHESAVHHIKLVDERVELADLFERGVLRVVGVDVGTERNGLRTAFRPFVAVDGGVERDAIDPRVHTAAIFELVEAQPEPDQNLLKQIVDFLVVAGEHVTDGVDRPFVLFHQLFELLFFGAFHLTVFWIFMALDNVTQKSLQKNHFFFTSITRKPSGFLVGLLRPSRRHCGNQKDG